MVWSMQFLSLSTLISHSLFQWYFIFFSVTGLIVRKKRKAITFYISIFIFVSLGGHGCLIMWESGCCWTMLVFQITTAGTTATRQAAVTPAPSLSSSVTADAASQITGPAMEITTVGTTATRPTQTAPIRVSFSPVRKLWLRKRDL